MIELKLNREQFSDYCRRSPNKSLKTTEEWLLFRVLARVNVALRRNRWYHEPRGFIRAFICPLSFSLRRGYSLA